MMSKAIENLVSAQRRATEGRPEVGGFPYLAETLRRAGVTSNVWHLPSCQSTYVTELGTVVQQWEPLATGTVEVPSFDSDALIAALRADQSGKTTFPEFLSAAWQAGVIRYEVDLAKRCVTYFGSLGKYYLEHYPEAAI
ncbi:DUF1398 domain-containing protein [Cupriavidus sp. 30B13]|uniref:DUF1398 domain-containing protein n=1 Tax=Cupriavidus sp. 30B13 TaxID=3384241 RepID=UPI003B8FFD6B